MQGFNMGRYVPPDLEGTVSGNALHAKLPPGRSAAKPGVQTVRFEMPFAIWCSTCPKPTIIGQGVRFNAEKRRTGAYHSTPIWTFRMRHAACGGTIEVATDPQNTAYVVVAGAAKRDTGPAARDGDGDLVVMTDEERAALRASAFCEPREDHRRPRRRRRRDRRIDDLEDVARRQERQAGVDDGLRARIGFDLDLLPATEADATRAALVEFGDHDDDDGDDAGKRAHRTLAKPLFVKAHGGGRREENKIKKSAAGGGTAAATPKSKLLASQRRAGFVSELVGNTRMATDPFLVDAKMSSSSTKMKGLISGIKRKREAAEGADAEQPTRETAQQEAAPPMGLVAYDSESD
ncbi:coiled-coil domain-containing protein [Verticillium dahliae VdLs.17]|uniref:Coiled-coil domain-containing protein n=1 Tax=Verticillium dahliae (strain VdLs.17 / ATCC MYA-4575 / FGSC 10137) TaxID=498257 RepID=G2XIT1_VERDV|nr:coiled-coil domain-containing protein [Verticillium dahliae VdLs.17]EGY20425.1 coiled-coil domain-containing protein [Verticillium dahliae VdLs.17]